ncbi:MAG: hypothetical protein H6948_18725 [Zoogloeaceae bacterium]|nr:hypothetical protein [Zoogloeaceae bacterium]
MNGQASAEFVEIHLEMKSSRHSRALLQDQIAPNQHAARALLLAARKARRFEPVARGVPEPALAFGMLRQGIERIRQPQRRGDAAHDIHEYAVKDDRRLAQDLQHHEFTDHACIGPATIRRATGARLEEFHNTNAHRTTKGLYGLYGYGVSSTESE